MAAWLRVPAWSAQAEAALSRISFLLQGFASTPEANYRFQLRPPPPTAAFHLLPPTAAGLVDLAGASAVSSIFPRLAATFPRPLAAILSAD